MKNKNIFKLLAAKKLKGIDMGSAMNTGGLTVRNRNGFDAKMVDNDQINSFILSIRTVWPDCKISVDKAEHEYGLTYIDVYKTKPDNKTWEYTIGWHADRGFLFYDNNIGFGDKPTSVVSTPEHAFNSFMRRYGD